MEQLSGASVILLEDKPEATQKVIQISGTPEQAERAQSLLQGFILSSKAFFCSIALASAFATKWEHTDSFHLCTSHLA